MVPFGWTMNVRHTHTHTRADRYNYYLHYDYWFLLFDCQCMPECRRSIIRIQKIMSAVAVAGVGAVATCQVERYL